MRTAESVLRTTGATLRAIASRRLSAIASPISMKPTGSSPGAMAGQADAAAVEEIADRGVAQQQHVLPGEAFGRETSSRVGATMAQVGMTTAS